MSTIPRPTMDDDSLKNSLVFSAALHLFLLIFLYFGLPVLFKPLPEDHPPVPFEIVDIAELTNTRVKEPEAQKPPAPEPPKPQPPQPPPEAQAKPPEPQQKPPEPQKPEPPKAEAEALKPLPVPQPKPKPPAETKQQQQDFDKLLKNLEQKAIQPPPVQKTVEQKPDSKTQAPAQSLAPTLSNRLTISEEDALRRQVEQCWNPPIGAPHPENLIVEVIITVNPDRTVQNAEIVDKSRMATDSYFRSAAEGALRALKSPNCTPLILPADKYDRWKTIDFTFDPRDM